MALPTLALSLTDVVERHFHEWARINRHVSTPEQRREAVRIARDAGLVGSIESVFDAVEEYGRGLLPPVQPSAVGSCRYCGRASQRDSAGSCRGCGAS